MANWDPTYPLEHKSWYEEYIHRQGAIAVSWLQQARTQGGSQEEAVEARGLSVYHPDGVRQQDSPSETVLAVSPLDDGSVCIWDVNGTPRSERGDSLAECPGYPVCRWAWG